MHLHAFIGMSTSETAGAKDESVLAALCHTMSLAVDRLNEEKEEVPCLSESETTVKMWGTQRRVIVDVLMACWGLGTWLGVNGLYVQLPLLVTELPESWTLASWMVLAIQLANIGLVIYAILKRLFTKISDSFYVHALLSIGILALVLNAFLYTKTITIGNTERSFAYLTLTFFAALVGCTSSVLFYPYLRYFRDIYLATYLVGEGLSGFVPSILSLIQGVGDDCSPARFSTTVFLVLLGCLSALSLVSFSILDKYSAFRSERVKPTAVAKEDEASTPREPLLRPSWVSVLVLMGVLNALMNGVMPSIQTYSCMPYGRRAYHLAVSLGAMANPAACLAGVWLRPVRATVLAAMLAAAAVPLGFVFATAALSPAPPLSGTAAGETLVILSWVCVSACVSYVRMWIYGWARQGGARGMRACGVATQTGSALGSLLSFLLVNVAELFTQAPSPVCPTSLASSLAPDAILFSNKAVKTVTNSGN